MGHPAKAGICRRVITKQILLLKHRKLRNDHCRFTGVSGFYDFKESKAFIYIQIHEAEIIDNKKVESCHFVCIVIRSTFVACFFALLQKAVRPDIFHSPQLMKSYYT